MHTVTTSRDAIIQLASAPTSVRRRGNPLTFARYTSDFTSAPLSPQTMKMDLEFVFPPNADSKRPDKGGQKYSLPFWRAPL